MKMNVFHFYGATSLSKGTMVPYMEKLQQLPTLSKDLLKCRKGLISRLVSLTGYTK